MEASVGVSSSGFVGFRVDSYQGFCGECCTVSAGLRRIHVRSRLEWIMIKNPAPCNLKQVCRSAWLSNIALDAAIHNAASKRLLHGLRMLNGT